MQTLNLVHQPLIVPDSHVWLADLRVRYDRLVARATGPEDTAAVVGLGVKLVELLGLVADGRVSPRDAALLPGLIRWISTQIQMLEALAAGQPLPFSLPSVPEAA